MLRGAGLRAPGVLRAPVLVLVTQARATTAAPGRRRRRRCTEWPVAAALGCARIERGCDDFIRGPWHLSRGTRATAGGIRAASGARSCPPPAPPPLTMCAARVQAIYAAGAPAGQVGRGESPVWQLEEELSHAARGVGEKRESLRQFESEEASSRLLSLRAAPRRAISRCRPARASCCAHRRSGARRVGAAGQFGGCAFGLAPTALWSRPAACFPSFSMAFVLRFGVSRWPVCAWEHFLAARVLQSVRRCLLCR